MNKEVDSKNGSNGAHDHHITLGDIQIRTCIHVYPSIKNIILMKKEREKKNSVRGGIRTHAHIRGPEYLNLRLQARNATLSLAP